MWYYNLPSVCQKNGVQQLLMESAISCYLRIFQILQILDNNLDQIKSKKNKNKNILVISKFSKNHNIWQMKINRIVLKKKRTGKQIDSISYDVVTC